MLQDPDLQLRLAAFEALDALTLRHGPVLPWELLSEGFVFQRERVLFGSTPRGIHRPRQMTGGALSIKTTIPKAGRQARYDDQVASADGHFVYKVELWVGRLAATHPPLEVRIAALFQPLLRGANAVGGLIRATLLALAPIVALGLAGRSFAARTSTWSLPDWPEPAVAPPVKPPAPSRSGQVQTDLGACTLRSAASTSADAVSWPENGTCCTIRSTQGSWLAVTCAGHDGWMHQSCLHDVRDVGCP